MMTTHTINQSLVCVLLLLLLLGGSGGGGVMVMEGEMLLSII